MSINALLQVAPGLNGAATADAEGSVSSFVGQGDMESLCTIAAMCMRPLDAAGEQLGFGPPQCWAFVNPALALYIKLHGNHFVVVRGDTNKSPHTVLSKIAQFVSKAR